MKAEGHVIGCCAVQKYALVSVEAADSRAFQAACTTLPIDCVTIDMSKRWEVDATSLKRAVARGVFVELQIGGVASATATSCGVETD